MLTADRHHSGRQIMRRRAGLCLPEVICPRFADTYRVTDALKPKPSETNLVLSQSCSADNLFDCGSGFSRDCRG